jgi:cobalt/nickel transport protein
MKITTKLWIGVIILAIISPLGLILPAYFKAGAAWCEWGKGLSGFWNAPFPDYAFKGWAEKSMTNLSAAYIASAIIGILACVGIMLLLGKFLTRKK